MTKNSWYERRKPRTAAIGDARTDLEVDYARVIHSSSFRRLAGKTQIHMGDSDIPRTRLTHSIEVSQIALGIAQKLKAAHEAEPRHDLDPLLADQSIWHVVGLCHDLGHSAGAHAGEEALNACVPFEGNGQTLRILARLEGHTPGYGLNLTRRSLLGILKYQQSYSEASTGQTPPPRRWLSGIPLIGPEHHPPKCFLDEELDVVEWLLAPPTIDAGIVRKEKLKSFDCGLMDLADDIAYSAADLDDAIKIDMMQPGWIHDDIPSEAWKGYLSYMKHVGRTPISSSEEIIERLMGSSSERRAITGSVISYFLSGIRLKHDDRMADPLYRYFVEMGPDQKRLMTLMKDCVFKRVIESTQVQQDRVRLQRQIIEVFDAFSYQPLKYLPERHRALWKKAENGDRVIADYISGMTDRFLEKTHRQMMG